MMQARSSRAKSAPAAIVAGSAGCVAIISFQSRQVMPACRSRGWSMPTTISAWVVRTTARITTSASFWLETITARAPEFSMMCAWSRSVLVV